MDVWALVAPALAVMMNVGMSGNTDAIEPTVEALGRTARRLRGVLSAQERSEIGEKKSLKQQQEELFQSHPMFRANVPHLMRDSPGR